MGAKAGQEVRRLNNRSRDFRRSNLFVKSRDAGEIRCKGTLCFVPLYRKDNTVRAWVTIDKADLELVKPYRWTLGSHGYPQCYPERPTRGRAMLMHRFLFGLAVGDKRQVDHRNRDKFDNRRSNLRVVTTMEQAQNRPRSGGKKRGRSRYRGVVLMPAKGRQKRWRAEGRVNGRYYSLGYYMTEGEAAEAAAAWRREHMTHATS